MGKTELLRAFCQGKRHIFFIADLGTEASALAEFTRQISQFAYGRPDAIGPFSRSGFTEALSAQAKAEEDVLLVDLESLLTPAQ